MLNLCYNINNKEDEPHMWFAVSLFISASAYGKFLLQMRFFYLLINIAIAIIKANDMTVTHISK